MVDKLTPMLELRLRLVEVELLEEVEVFARQHSFESLETLLNSVEVLAMVTLLGTEPEQHVLYP